MTVEMGGHGLADRAAGRRIRGHGVVPALLALAVGASAASAGEAAEDPFRRGRVQLGLHAGLSVPYDFYDETAEVEESRFVALLPRASIGLGDPIGQGWIQGNFELVAEIAVLLQFEPRNGYAAGGTLLARYNFLAWRPLVPFVEAGAGLAALQFDLDRRSDGFNFTPQAGFGLHWWLAPRTALTAQWRYHHISNAGIRHPNVAVDSNLFLVGATFFLR